MFHVPNACRILNGPMRSTDAHGNNGAFFVPPKIAARELWVIASNGEEYRPIRHFDSLYEVSNLGHVRAFVKNVDLPYGGVRHHSEHLLAQEVIDSGYVRVSLCRGGCIKKTLVHRLVAEAFIPNPSGYRFVNHRNGQRAENIVTNLEWCSAEYNRHHAIEMGTAPGFTVAEILEIKALLDAGESPESIAARWGKSRQTMSDIKFGRHRNLLQEEVSGPGEWPLLWEHVSVHAANRTNKLFMPTWDEMCYIKGLFWDDEDAVMQLHPPKSQWVNNHPTTLHLWRPLHERIPLPPGILVGVQGMTLRAKG